MYSKTFFDSICTLLSKVSLLEVFLIISSRGINPIESSFKVSFIISFVAFVQFALSSKFPKVGKLNFSFILVSSSTFLTSWPLSNELNRPKI